MAKFDHYSVMLSECVESLRVGDGYYVDCTAGGGGHSLEIIKKIKNGKLVAIDRDIAAINAVQERLKVYKDKLITVKDNFFEVEKILDSLGIDKINGALIDLGVSSYQLDTPERGFSYMHDAPLDMRMDTGQTLSAFDVVNTYSESELKRILREYGEESFAPQIASKIVQRREKEPICTTFQLADVIKSAMPAKARNDRHHPCKRSFQAIRIEVNSELEVIEPTLRALADRLVSGGRLAVITFHSLEDRIAKQTFADLSRGCTCPPDFPVCVCNKKPSVRMLNKKPILPSEEELMANPRSRSAKLRVVEKL